MYQKGALPAYTDFPEPVVQKDNERLISVKAAAIKRLDKAMASGKHYSAKAEPGQARVIGGDGVGLLEDGRRVYAIGTGGMMAEKAVIEEDLMVVLPPGIDDLTAAALPNAVMGSAMALRFRAGMQPGETVLINGATGFTGKVAVQVAKHYGAGKIIVTGRNERSLQSLLALGANEVVSLKQEDEACIAQLRNLHHTTPVDVVLDYLWGHPAALILSALKGNGAFTHRTRFISAGAVTGDLLQISAAQLRSADLQLCGSGLGSWTKDNIRLLFSEILPEMFRLAAHQQLKVDTVGVSLKDIERLWEMEMPDGKRLVAVI